jgi:hypothetical protein
MGAGGLAPARSDSLETDGKAILTNNELTIEKSGVLGPHCRRR